MGIFSSKFELVNSDSQSWSIFKGKDVSLTNHDFWPKFSEGASLMNGTVWWFESGNATKMYRYVKKKSKDRLRDPAL